MKMMYNAIYILNNIEEGIKKMSLFKKIRKGKNITYSNLDKRLKDLISLNLIRKERKSLECNYYLTEKGKSIQNELNGIFNILNGGIKNV